MSSGVHTRDVSEPLIWSRVHIQDRARDPHSSTALVDHDWRLLLSGPQEMVDEATIRADSGPRCRGLEGDYCLWTGRNDPCLGRRALVS